MDTKFYFDSSNLRLGLPISKVDAERRIVSGFATLDNMDAHGDVITAEASIEAFSSFRGNIREMHGENAVGKLVNFEEKSLHCSDPNCDEMHRGIFVDVYVSKAEEEIWTKIQEGIFSGFSIGGKILEKAPHEDPEKKGYLITKYELFELSIVDSPANPLANVMAISKSKEGGIVGDTQILNIYKKNDMVLLSREVELEGFENVGWIEDTDEEINKVAEKYADLRKSNAAQLNITISDSNGSTYILDGNDTFTTNTTFAEAEIAKKAIAEEKGGVDMAEENVVEETEVVDEVADAVEEEATDVAKEVEGLDVDDLMTKFAEELGKLGADVAKAVDEVKTSFTEAIDTVKGELSDSITSVKDELSKIEERVSAVEDDTATKKSIDGRNDVEDEEDDEEDGFWLGSGFSPVSNLKK